MDRQRIANSEPKAANRPAFNWAIYADATLAGLSTLIPIPFVDSTIEDHFRRRMVHSIAQQRSRALHPAAVRTLDESRLTSAVRQIVALPLSLTVGLAMRLSRKLIYFMSVKRAVDALSYYWRRAYLLDYMVRQGHLSDETTAPAAAAALDAVLAQSGSGPFRWVAQQVVAHTPHVVKTIWDARHGHEDALVLNIRAALAERWPEIGDYLVMLAGRYDEQYDAMRRLSRQRQAGTDSHPSLRGQPQEG
jgi:hypothetical protein